MPELVQIRTALVVWLALTAACGALAAALWRWRPGVRRLLDPQPREPVPWSGPEVYLVLFVYFLIPGFVHSALLALNREPAALGVVIGGGTVAASRELHGEHLQLWVMLLSTPILVLAVLLLTRFASGTRPEHLGLSGRRLRGNVKLGLLVGLVCTPALNAFHAAVSWLMLEFFQAVPEEHPLTRLAQQGLAPWEWIALVATAVAAAPVTEELLFRGVVQRWLANRSWGGDAALLGALLLAVLTRADRLSRPDVRDSIPVLLTELGPALFVLFLVPFYLAVRWRASSPSPTAVFGTAALFAAVHGSVWPTPIPLFLLGLILGTLVQRTQNLTAAFVVHALFNAVASGWLLLGG